MQDCQATNKITGSDDVGEVLSRSVVRPINIVTLQAAVWRGSRRMGNRLQQDVAAVVEW